MPRKRWLGSYVLWLTLMAAGLLIGPGLVTWLVVREIGRPDHAVEFEAPGETIYTSRTVEPVIIWNETEGVFQGTVRTSDHALPSGLKVTVNPVSSGKPVPVLAAGGASLTRGPTSRESAFTFTPPAPGDYRIQITGDFPPRVMAVSTDDVRQLLVFILKAAFIGVVGSVLMLGGLAMTIVTVIRHAFDSSNGRVSYDHQAAP